MKGWFSDMKTSNLNIYPRVSFEGKIEYVYALPTEKGTGTNVSGVMKVKTSEKSSVDVPFTIFIGKEKDSKDEKEKREYEKLFDSGFVHNANVVCVGSFFSTTVLRESGLIKEKGELTANDKIIGFAIKIDCFDVLDSPEVIKNNVELFNAKHKNVMKTKPEDMYKDKKIGRYQIECDIDEGKLAVLNTLTQDYIDDDTDVPIDQYYNIIEKYKNIVKEEKQKAKNKNK